MNPYWVDLEDTTGTFAVFELDPTGEPYPVATGLTESKARQLADKLNHDYSADMKRYRREFLENFR